MGQNRFKWQACYGAPEMLAFAGAIWSSASAKRDPIVLARICTKTPPYGLSRSILRLVSTLGIVLAFGSGYLAPAQAQLFTNVDYIIQHRVGDPEVDAEYSLEGPKGIISADFDADGVLDLAVSNSDGTVTLLWGGSEGRFHDPLHLQTAGADLRGIASADFNKDGRLDLAAVSPFDGSVYLFLGSSSRTFAPVRRLAAWSGARNLTAGDFDGDGTPDLAVAGTTNGVCFFRGAGDGSFTAINSVRTVAAPFDQRRFPKPVYTLQSSRRPYHSWDELLVTHAHTNTVFRLGNNAYGQLAVQGSGTLDWPCQSFDTGRILSTNGSAGGFPEFIGVHLDQGTVAVYRGTDTPLGFDPKPVQILHIAGGPRAARVVDLDRDGWNDLVVVIRNLDAVHTYRNEHGRLQFSTERPVSISPRELAIGDFDRDGSPDAAVMCHDSETVNILLTYPTSTGFSAVDNMYLVDGSVAGLTLLDFNQDGRDDVIQLHRASGDFSVRLASAEGLLGAPSFYTIGRIPASQVVAFANRDSIPDILTANLGTGEIEPGSVSVRLGRADGGFEPERRYQLPAGRAGRIYGLLPADFNGDGALDLAAGFLDGRLAFFVGAGDGTFAFTREHQLASTAQNMVAGDFDQDGDLDIAIVNLTGELLVIHNRGDLMRETALAIESYPPPSTSGFGANTLKAVRFNADEDLDLVLGNRSEALLYLGGPGMSFQSQPVPLAGINFPVGNILEGDFDNDGNPELVVANKRANRLTYLFGKTGGTNYATSLSVDVPSSKYIAAGYVDDDDKLDLVGTGEILWTVLSGRAARRTPPLRSQNTRPRQTLTPVLNEILAINDSLPLDLDQDRVSDWVEIYNGTSTFVRLANWRLRLVKGLAGATTTNEFVFPATATLLNGYHMVVIFSQEKHTVYHTGFALPGEGANLILLDSTGTNVVDTVTYPPQTANISYSRFWDGSSTFVQNPYPNPNQPNTDNGRIAPDVSFLGPDPATVKPGVPLQFGARLVQGEGLAGLSLVYQRLDNPVSLPSRIVFYDDGLHEDGPGSDGTFSGTLDHGIPAGAECQYYMELVDLFDQVFTVPEDPVFARPGLRGNVDAFGIPSTNQLPLEISEVVPLNDSTLADERGGYPDWVEIRNISTNRVSLRGVSLSHQLGDGDQFIFGDNDELEGGKHLVIFCDNNPAQGADHAAFTLRRTGDQLVLCSTSTNGARVLLDWTRFNAVPVDTAWARLGARGPWLLSPATPRRPNLVGSWRVDILRQDKEPMFGLVFNTQLSTNYTVETCTDLATGWNPLTTIPGDGLEHLMRLPMNQTGFFRVQIQPSILGLKN